MLYRYKCMYQHRRCKEFTIDKMLLFDIKENTFAAVCWKPVLKKPFVKNFHFSHLPILNHFYIEHLCQ